jgi:hypothetical protein
MANDLIIVPQYNTIEIKLPVSFNLIYNGSYRVHEHRFRPEAEIVVKFAPRNMESRLPVQYRKAYQKGLIAYQKFHCEFTIVENPWRIIKSLEDFESKYKFPIHRFLTRNKKSIITPNDGAEIYEINYYEIREEIISFLQQTIGETKEVALLKDLFRRTPTDITDFEKYLNEKAKYLLKLDTKGIEDELKQTPCIDKKDRDSYNDYC